MTNITMCIMLNWINWKKYKWNSNKSKNKNKNKKVSIKHLPQTIFVDSSKRSHMLRRYFTTIIFSSILKTEKRNFIFNLTHIHQIKISTILLLKWESFPQNIVQIRTWHLLKKLTETFFHYFILLNLFIYFFNSNLFISFEINLFTLWNKVNWLQNNKNYVNSLNVVFFPYVNNTLEADNSFSFIEISPYDLPILRFGSLATFTHNFYKFLFINLFCEILKFLRIPKLLRSGWCNL